MVLILSQQLNNWTLLGIQDWLINQVAESTELDVDDIDTSQNFSRFNIDSSEVIGISGNIEDVFKIKTDPTLLYDYVNIDSLSNYIFLEINK